MYHIETNIPEEGLDPIVLCWCNSLQMYLNTAGLANLTTYLIQHMPTERLASSPSYKKHNSKACTG